MVLLDTHTLVWWTLDRDKLSQRALVNCNKIENDGAYVSSISIWEIGIKIKNKKLDIGMSIETYYSKLKSMNILTFIPVDEAIWIASLNLQWAHRDPADRIIVATARMQNASIISKDEMIQQFYKKTIW